MSFAKAFTAEEQYSESHQQHTAKLRVIPGGRPASPKGELRKSRRIPVACRIEFKTQEAWDIHHGTSLNLSVDGLSFVTDYVPRFGQLLEIHMIPPQGAAIRALRALVQVRRCTQVVAGKEYEVGTAIIKIRE